MARRQLRDDLRETICPQTFPCSQQTLSPSVMRHPAMIKLEREDAAMVVIREPIWRNQTR